MSKFEYLSWMAKSTPTQWCNDSALMTDLDAALASGAIGCTSNPPLTYEALTVETNLYADSVAAIAPTAQGDDRVVELLGVVVRNIARRLRGIYETSGKARGYVRSQVQPKKSGNGAAMLRQALRIASWSENVMVKYSGDLRGNPDARGIGRGRHSHDRDRVCICLPDTCGGRGLRARLGARQGGGTGDGPSTAAISWGGCRTIRPA